MSPARTGNNLWGKDDPRRTLFGMAEWIFELRHLMVITTWSLARAFSPQQRAALEAELAEQDQFIGMPDIAGNIHGVEILPSLKQIGAYADRTPGAYSSVMAAQLAQMTTVTQLADAIEHFGFYQRFIRQEQIQFLRHLRNAFAHGGMWSFDPNKIDFMDRPAKANGVSLDLSVNGRSLWSTVGPGDILVLFNELLAFFTTEIDKEEAAAAIS